MFYHRDASHGQTNYVGGDDECDLDKNGQVGHRAEHFDDTPTVREENRRSNRSDTLLSADGILWSGVDCRVVINCLRPHLIVEFGSGCCLQFDDRDDNLRRDSACR